VDLMLGWYLPAQLHRLGAAAVYALMDEPLLDAFGFPRPSPALRRIVEQSLRIRAAFVRQLPQRRRPYLVSTIRHRSYPRGYRLEDLGPRPAVSGGVAGTPLALILSVRVTIGRAQTILFVQEPSTAYTAVARPASRD
jgi:hypothetical protein